MFFGAMPSSCPKDSKNVIKMKSAYIFFLRVMVWYALHAKFSEKLVLRQMTNVGRILQHLTNIMACLRNVYNFPN